MEHPRRGIIPAYAGNTAVCNGSSACKRDHPRVCGEHGSPAQVTCTRPGSSPRMRGTHVDRIGLLSHLGIIPAYAGNTHRMRHPYPTSGDHPRVCGEHRLFNGVPTSVPGSSPRMRGTPIVIIIILVKYGIIPAYAGNTLYFKFSDMF